MFVYNYYNRRQTEITLPSVHVRRVDRSVWALAKWVQLIAAMKWSKHTARYHSLLRVIFNSMYSIDRKSYLLSAHSLYTFDTQSLLTYYWSKLSSSYRVFPHSAATCNGVFSWSFFECAGIFSFKRRSTIARLPFAAATCNGVFPVESQASQTLRKIVESITCGVNSNKKVIYYSNLGPTSCLIITLPCKIYKLYIHV